MANIVNPGDGPKQLDKMFQEYLKYSKKEPEVAVLKQSKELSEFLFIETYRAKAPDIWNKLVSLGWNFIRAPWSYVRKVGPNANANGQSTIAPKEAGDDKLRQKRAREFELASGVRKQARKLTRKKKTKTVADIVMAAKMRKSADVIEEGQKHKFRLAEQKYAAYNYRMSHIGSQASSWIPAMRRLGSKMKTAQGEKRGPKMRPMCDVVIELVKGIATVTIINKMPGLYDLAARTGLVEKAFTDTNANMKKYIDEKKEELANIFNRTGAR